MSEPREQLPEGDSELWSLVEAVVEGTAGPQEQERLGARLRAETPCRCSTSLISTCTGTCNGCTGGESGEPAGQVGRIGNPSPIGSPCGTDCQSVLPQAAPLPSRLAASPALPGTDLRRCPCRGAAGLLFAVFWSRPGEEGNLRTFPTCRPARWRC